MNSSDLHSRIQRLLDDELSGEEIHALEAELLEHPEALETYRDYIDLHCGLQRTCAIRSSAGQMSAIPVDKLIAFERRRVRKISVLAAAAILLISAAALWMNFVPAAPSSLASFRVAPGSALTVSHQDSEETIGGNTLATGSRLTLDHGVAKLELPHDVIAVVEAPASLVLLDDRTLQMDHGSAYFQINSEEGQGFTVVTAHQRIVDLGTAFGVAARLHQEEVELHVFEGRVRVDDVNGDEGKVIPAKRSVLLAGKQVKRNLVNTPEAFQTELPTKVATVLAEDFESGLITGREYAVQIDPTAIRDHAGNRFPGLDNDTAWNFSITPPATTPLACRSYTYDTEQPSNHVPSGHQPGLFLDPSHTKLTDGDSGADAGWFSGTYVGFKNPSGPIQITFDLGHAQSLASIILDLSKNTAGIPKDLKMAISHDGKVFPPLTPVIPTTTHAATGNNFSFTINMDAWAPARFVRLEMEATDEWTFLGEGRFEATSMPAAPIQLSALLTDTPEPTPSLSDRDDSPPALLTLHPADNSAATSAGGKLAMVFNEPIKLGTGRIFFRNLTHWSESEIAVGGPRTSVQDRLLTITPPARLKDGERQLGGIANWTCTRPFHFFNPSGDDRSYTLTDLTDTDRSRGIAGPMLGPTMASFGPSQPGLGISRDIETIAPNQNYTVSAAIGVRNDDAASFLGYSIRLRSGDTVLAEVSSEEPPGPPNSITNVGFSWDSCHLPPGVTHDDPLTLEIIPGHAAGLAPGYLDLDHVRVSRVKR